MPRPTPTFTRFLALPENRAALLAVQDLAKAIASSKVQQVPQPLYLHGPSGSGKSHLASSLANEVARLRPDLVIAHTPASLLSTAAGAQVADVQGRLFEATAVQEEQSADPFASLRDCDLAIIEDVQHLASNLLELFTQLLDDLLARRTPTLVTGLMGPAHLEHRGQRFPARVRSRLAGGLAVGLQPLGVDSRKLFLAEQAQRRQLAIAPGVLAWVAENVAGGARSLEGAIHSLDQLNRLRFQPLDVPAVAAYFREQAEACRVTVERIADEVGGFFRVPADQLQSRSRLRGVLVPRQVSMYLARQLTSLSLEQIGAFFGGRDHSTVLHACRKVEAALVRDALLSGAVRQLKADLA